MGVYYSGISKQTRMIDGHKVAKTNFYGKAPSVFSENTGRWDRFETRSFNAAKSLEDVEYVVYGDFEEGAEVAKWNGQSIVSDGFWDNSTVGRLVKEGRKWAIKWSEGSEPA